MPLSVLEHPLWREVFHFLRPSYIPPTRKVLSTTLLEKEFNNVKREVDTNIKASKNLHLAVDGWSNIRNEGILNFIIYTPKPYFYSFVETKKNRHTSKYLLGEVIRVIEELGAENFLTVVSDNAANMMKCGKLLEEKYNHIIWIGCLAHTFHLMVSDILKIESVAQVFCKSIEIIKCIRQSQIMSATFKQIRQEKQLNISLHLPVKTRWGSYLQSLDSLVASKLILQNMAVNYMGDKTVLKNLRQNILDDDIWSQIEDLRQVLRPIVNLITKLEGDYCGVHLVYKAFVEINTTFENLPNIFTASEAEVIQSKFAERKANALKSIHFAACILDPKTQGSNLSESELIDGCELIDFVATSMVDVDDKNALAQLGQYRSREGIWAKLYIWKSFEMEPVVWWKTFFLQTDLAKTAIRVLTTPATSASVERSFSTFSNIHSKKRHKLTTERAGRLCYIAHNWKALQPQSTQNIPKVTADTIEAAGEPVEETKSIASCSSTETDDENTTDHSSCSCKSLSEVEKGVSSDEEDETT